VSTVPVEQPAPGKPLLSVRDLHVTFEQRGRRPTVAVDGVSFDIHAGSTVALVGESGCGKTVTSLAMLRLLPERGVRVSGSVHLQGRDLFGLPEPAMEGVRGGEIAMVFQDPMTSLNPVLTVGRQLSEVLERHFQMRKPATTDEAVRLLDSVGIPSARRRLDDYPHQLSGGMRQRVMIAMALACRPKLLVADEPTTALDVTIQAQILQLLRDLITEYDTALLMITHDLGVVAGLCETVHVMYSGRFVESAGRHDLFARPRHPYTAGLLASVPRLDDPRGVALKPIKGSPRDVIPWTSGCAFAPRCGNRIDACTASTPALEPDDGRDLRCFNPVARPAEPAARTSSPPGRESPARDDASGGEAR
jgi:peptide/nickel transport system ATP-binding protein